MRLSNSKTYRALGAAAMICVVATSSAVATDFVVQPGQSIQAAIQGAQHGDRILVQPGTYVGGVSFAGKGIELIGLGGASQTTIDGGGIGTPAAVRFPGNEPAGARISGFTVRNARVGVYVSPLSHARIEQCVVEANLDPVPLIGGEGYGIHTQYQEFAIDRVQVFDTVIRGNASTGFIGVGRLERCVISGNGVWGINGIGPLVVRDCRITENQSPYDGGGLTLNFPSMFGNPKPIQLERCLIANNVCQGSGGGVFASGIVSNIVISQCEITGNVAGEQGGGIYLESVPESPFIQGGSLTVERSVLANNHAGVKGGAIYGGGTPDLLTRRCTVTNNTPDGVFGSQHRDGIYWNQIDPFAGVSGADVDHCVVQGGYPGNNFSFDPFFIDAPNGDFRLRADSPCRDLGGTTIGVDFEGDPLVGPADLGADEFRSHLSFSGSTTPGDLATIRLVGEPGAAPLLLFVSTALSPTGVPTPYGLFHLGFPLIPGFPVDLGTMPAGSSLAIPVPIPSTIPEGFPIHLQAFVGGSNPTLTNAATVVFG